MKHLLGAKGQAAAALVQDGRRGRDGEVTFILTTCCSLVLSSPSIYNFAEFLSCFRNLELFLELILSLYELKEQSHNSEQPEITKIRNLIFELCFNILISIYPANSECYNCYTDCIDQQCIDQWGFYGFQEFFPTSKMFYMANSKIFKVLECDFTNAFLGDKSAIYKIYPNFDEIESFFNLKIFSENHMEHLKYVKGLYLSIKNSSISDDKENED